jgi:hypothetical protein
MEETIIIDYKSGMNMLDEKITAMGYKPDTTWEDIESFINANGEEKQKIAERILCVEKRVKRPITKVK